MDVLNMMSTKMMRTGGEHLQMKPHFLEICLFWQEFTITKM